MAINPDRLKAQVPINQAVGSGFSIEKELQVQKEILLKIYEDTRKTRRYIMLGKIISAIYLILIIAPLILAAIYLPPLLKNVVGPYKELLDVGQTKKNLNVNLKQIDIDKANQLLKTLK